MVQIASRAVFMALFLVFVCLVETETGAQFYDQSYALVIGIDKYLSPKRSALTYAVKDAQSMEGFLKQQEFQVTSIYNEKATRNTIIYQMQNVLARRVKKGDRVLIFFAGHGDTERYDDIDYGYIVPHDATESSHTYISMEELQTLSRKMGQAKHQLFIMDACYGGLLGVRSGAISENVPNYLGEITKRKARQILTAGGPNQQVVDGGPGGHSVFAGYLLKGLQEGAADLNGDGYVTFTELASYLVPAATNTYQTPGSSTLSGHELGEFVFRSPRPVTQPRIEATTSTDLTRRGPAPSPVIQSHTEATTSTDLTRSAPGPNADYLDALIASAHHVNEKTDAMRQEIVRLEAEVAQLIQQYNQRKIPQNQMKDQSYVLDKKIKDSKEQLKILQAEIDIQQKALAHEKVSSNKSNEGTILLKNLQGEINRLEGNKAKLEGDIQRLSVIQIRPAN